MPECVTHCRVRPLSRLYGDETAANPGDGAVTMRSPRVSCWTVHSVTDEHGLSHSQQALKDALLLYMEREQEKRLHV